MCLQNVRRGGRGDGKLAREYLRALWSFDAQRDLHVMQKSGAFNSVVVLEAGALTAALAVLRWSSSHTT